MGLDGVFPEHRHVKREASEKGFTIGGERLARAAQGYATQ
jgi:hypothetical protein